jgi:regulator of RNase E activity RraA
VLVLASNGHEGTSLAGGVKLSRAANTRMAGVLADGRLRDFDELAGYAMTVYCRGQATKWGGDVVTPLLAIVPVVISGVAVMPGDVVFADGAGAVVVPPGEVARVVDEAHRVNAQDAESPRLIRTEGGDNPHEP